MSEDRAGWLRPQRLGPDLMLGLWVLLVGVFYLGGQLRDSLSLLGRVLGG